MASRSARRAGLGARRAGAGRFPLGLLLLASLLVPGVLGCGGGGGGAAETSVQRFPHGEFVTSVAGPRAVVWAVGDGADGGASAQKVTALIAAGRPDRLLYLGDVYETGSRSDFANHYAPTYGRLAARTAPTPGNHDWPQHLQGYDPYWGRTLRRPPPGFYAFRIGGWEIFSLNSEGPHGRRSAQDRWLRQQVRRPGTCRLAFWHRPRYSGGVEHGDEPDVQPFWDALRGHATLIVNGHEHDMQRFRPVGGLHRVRRRRRGTRSLPGPAPRRPRLLERERLRGAPARAQPWLGAMGVRRAGGKGARQRAGGLPGGLRRASASSHRRGERTTRARGSGH